WALSADDGFRLRLEHLQTESDLLGRAELVDAPEQQLTPVDRFDEEEVERFVCAGVPQVDPDAPGELAERIAAGVPAVRPWLDAVREIQHLARTGQYRIVFFINMAPEVCPGEDRFYNAGSLNDERVLLRVL